jgi:hypothetical protein
MPPPTITTSKELAVGEMMPAAFTGAARAEFAAPAGAE